MHQTIPNSDDYKFSFFDSDREERSWYWQNSSQYHNANSSEDEESLQNYRDLLEVPTCATRREIETEFRRKSLEFHPGMKMNPNLLLFELSK